MSATELPGELLALLRCPCGGGLERGAGGLECVSCGRRAALEGGIADFLGEGELEGSGALVRAFYERRPFPGYGPSDDAASLLDRARSSPFLVALDAAAGARARVLDCGCGTGQAAAFLALSAARRTVVGLDGCRASLSAAAAFRERAGARNLHLVRGDLLALPLAAGAFDAVLCRGVVHHTADPFEAIERVAAAVAPGGLLVLGFYESAARLPHRARRALWRLWPAPAAALDPVLRRGDLAQEKRAAWIDDQYRHPLERSLALGAVSDRLGRLGFEVLRTVPPAADDLTEREPRPPGAGFLRRAGWLLRGLGDEDAGLVCAVARRHCS